MAEYGQRVTSSVAGQLADLRRQRGMSMDALSEAAGVHRTSISLIEKGRRGVTIALAAELARAMGVSLGQLVIQAEEAARRD